MSADRTTRPSRQTVVRVARLPVGLPQETDFQVSSEAVPEPRDGEFLARADTYFDNVGGGLLQSVFSVLNLGGAVIMCGLVSQYNAEGPPPGVNLGPAIARRARLLSLVVYDYQDKYEAYLRRASDWVRSGRLRYLEDRALGIESAPRAFVRLMRGDNVGKSLVVVGPESV